MSEAEGGAGGQGGAGGEGGARGQGGAVRRAVQAAAQPVLVRGGARAWLAGGWTLQRWADQFGERALPFRCARRGRAGAAGPCSEPRWERACRPREMTFGEFVARAESPREQDWMYFDYKRLQRWLRADSALLQEVSWARFGFPEQGAAESTLWVGSEGAHTPAHRDTYGTNIVTQLYGKKRWILFPPEAGGMKPTRVPYEESSIYSEINFYRPLDGSIFKGLHGARTVELEAGDALIVPNGWWHYVENTSTVGISLNMWVPHENDSSAQVSEALIRILVTQLCKDLPQNTTQLLLNPNEDDLPETPLSVLFLQLDTVARNHLEKQRKLKRMKRQRTREDDASTTDEPVDVNALIDDKANNMEYLPSVTSEELIDILKRHSDNSDRTRDEDEVDGGASKLHLTKALINAYSQDNAIEIVKQNLFASLKSD